VNLPKIAKKCLLRSHGPPLPFPWPGSRCRPGIARPEIRNYHPKKRLAKHFLFAFDISFTHIIPVSFLSWKLNYRDMLKGRINRLMRPFL